MEGSENDIRHHGGVCNGEKHISYGKKGKRMTKQLLVREQLKLILGTEEERHKIRKGLISKLLGVEFGKEELEKERSIPVVKIECDKQIELDAHRTKDIYVDGIKGPEFTKILCQTCHNVFVADKTLEYVQGYSYIASMFLSIYYDTKQPEISLMETTFYLRHFTRLFCLKLGPDSEKTKNCASLIIILCDIIYRRNKMVNSRQNIKNSNATGSGNLKSYEIGTGFLLPAFTACCVDSLEDFKASQILFDVVLCLGPSAPIYMYVSGIILNNYNYEKIEDGVVGNNIKTMFNKRYEKIKPELEYYRYISELSLLLFVHFPLDSIDFKSYGIDRETVQHTLIKWGFSNEFKEMFKKYRISTGLSKKLPVNVRKSWKFFSLKKQHGSSFVLAATVVSFAFFIISTVAKNNNNDT